MKQAAPRLVLAVFLLGLAPLGAQTPSVIGFHLPAATGWGPITNTSASPMTSTPILISRPSSPWLKLWFSAADLGSGSKIRLTGVQDQVVQTLDAAGFAAWSGTSAYFNGNAVIVELVIPPGDHASAFINGYDTGFDSPLSPDTICGLTDDRVPSTERRVGRFLDSSNNAICSGALVSANSCYLTAGHCVTTGNIFTVEFNCPLSTITGNVVHPGPQDQYPLIYSTMGWLSGGIGADYALGRLANNTNTGLPASLVQGHYALAATLPAAGATARITGFGTATGVLNQANQTATGLELSAAGTTLQYSIDTTGGNSGSAVVLDSNQTVYGVHTNGGCTSSGGSNFGTAITYAGIQTTYASVCNPNPPMYAVTVTQTAAGAPIQINVVHAPASSELFNIVSTTPAVPTNSGPIVGLVINPTDLVNQVTMPLGSAPFHVLANASGAYSLSVPTSLPGLLLNFDVVSVAFTPGGAFASYLGRSPAINATVHL